MNWKILGIAIMIIISAVLVIFSALDEYFDDSEEDTKH